MRPFRPFKLLAASLLLASCGGPPCATVSTPMGDFRTTFVADRYPYSAERASPERIAAVITTRFPARHDPQLSNLTVAGKIVAASECFGIDAAVYAGLIRQESAFNRHAVSATGASGLTQFTTIGIREVNDQLGERGPAEARATATRYFNDVIATCLQQTLLAEPWTQLWRRVGVDLMTMRNALRGDADTALVYGAVMLKTMLSVVRTVDSTLPIVELYKQALRRYNGDPTVQDEYAAKVLRFAAEFGSGAAAGSTTPRLGDGADVSSCGSGS